MTSQEEKCDDAPRLDNTPNISVGRLQVLLAMDQEKFNMAMNILVKKSLTNTLGLRIVYESLRILKTKEDIHTFLSKFFSWRESLGSKEQAKRQVLELIKEFVEDPESRKTAEYWIAAFFEESESPNAPVA